MIILNRVELNSATRLDSQIYTKNCGRDLERSEDAAEKPFHYDIGGCDYLADCSNYY